MQRRALNHWKEAGKAAAFFTVAISVSFVATELGLTLRSARAQIEAIPALADSRAASIQADLGRQITALRGDLTGQVAGLRGDLNRQADGTRADASAAIAGLSATLDNRAAAIQADLNAQLTATRAQLDAPVQQATAAVSDIDRAVKLLTPQALGLVAASKVTMGQAAQTMRTVDKATPAIVASVQKAADKSAEASGHASDVAANLAEATKPLPRWARVGLAAAPPLASVASAFVGMWYMAH